MRGLRTGANGLRHPTRGGVAQVAPTCERATTKLWYRPDTPAPFMERAQRRGRGVNTSRDWVGTAQTTVSVGRLGVEGTKEDMGAGACTQTPGAPAAGRNAAATRHRDKCALPHGDSAVPLMDPLTPALKSTIMATHPLPPRLPCLMGNRVLLWTARRCRPHLCALWCGWMSSGRRHPKTRQRPVYIHVCMYVCMYVYIHIYLYIRITNIRAYIHTCIHTYVCTYMHAREVVMPRGLQTRVR